MNEASWELIFALIVVIVFCVWIAVSVHAAAFGETVADYSG